MCFPLLFLFFLLHSLLGFAFSVSEAELSLTFFAFDFVLAALSAIDFLCTFFFSVGLVESRTSSFLAGVGLSRLGLLGVA